LDASFVEFPPLLLLPLATPDRIVISNRRLFRES
jgi:hypothetical protein